MCYYAPPSPCYIMKFVLQIPSISRRTALLPPSPSLAVAFTHGGVGEMEKESRIISHPHPLFTFTSFITFSPTSFPFVSISLYLLLHLFLFSFIAFISFSSPSSPSHLHRILFFLFFISIISFTSPSSRLSPPLHLHLLPFRSSSPPPLSSLSAPLPPLR